MTENTVIVYGPPACGKTRNAERLMQYLNCDRVIDSWRDRDPRQPLTPGALHLTWNYPNDLVAQGHIIWAFSDIMAEINATEPGPLPLPDGEYAIVEVLGHRTIVGRVTEVERFGAKLCSIEPVFNGTLLEAVQIGGASIYQFTPCSAEKALSAAPKSIWNLPAGMRALVPPAMLPAPVSDEELDDLPF